MEIVTNQEMNTEKEMGFFSRLINIIIEPSKVFKELETSSKILAVIIFMCIISTILAIPNATYVENYTRDITEKIYTSDYFIHSNPQMSKTQMDNGIEMGAKIAKYSTYAAAVFLLLLLLIEATVFCLLIKMFGGKGNFKTTFFVLVYAYLVKLIGTAVLTVNIVMSGKIEASTSLAVLLTSDKTNYLYNLLSLADIFTIWALALSAIGMSIVHNISKKKAFSIIFITWLAYISIQAFITTNQAVQMFNTYGITM